MRNSPQTVQTSSLVLINKHYHFQLCTTGLASADIRQVEIVNMKLKFMSWFLARSSGSNFLQHVDLENSTLCGDLKICGLTEQYPELTTFFEVKRNEPLFAVFRCWLTQFRQKLLEANIHLLHGDGRPTRQSISSIGYERSFSSFFICCFGEQKHTIRLHSTSSLSESISFLPKWFWRHISGVIQLPLQRLYIHAMEGRKVASLTR